MSVSSPERVDHLPSSAMDDSWRTWLMTGTRRPPIDRRRVRGANKGLKKMLVEGMGNGSEGPRSWLKFSGAMVRQAVDDGVRALPPQQKQLIKLAYFGGLTNAEIAERLGVTISTVERGLRQAIARVSEYVERGRAAGRKALYALLFYFYGRSAADALNPAPTSEGLVRVAAMAAVAATAGAVLLVQPASPARLAPVEPVSVAGDRLEEAPANARRAATARDLPGRRAGKSAAGDCSSSNDSSGDQRAGDYSSDRSSRPANRAPATEATCETQFSRGVGRVHHNSVDGRDHVVAIRDQVGEHPIVAHGVHREIAPPRRGGVDDERGRVRVQVRLQQGPNIGSRVPVVGRDA